MARTYIIIGLKTWGNIHAETIKISLIQHKMSNECSDPQIADLNPKPSDQHLSYFQQICF